MTAVARAILYMITKIRLPILTALIARQAELTHNTNGALGLSQSEILIKRGTGSRSKHNAGPTPDPLKVFAALEALEVAS